MAWTQTDLDAIDAAIGSGELTIRTAEGKMVTYRSMAELERARGIIAGALAEDDVTTAPASRRRYAEGESGW